LIHFDCSEPSPNELETTRAFIEEVVQGRTFNRQNLLASQLSPAAARQHARFFERLLAA
jgi:hypothetical protein